MLFLLCSPLRSSSVSVVFDFNASLNDAVPVSPMLLSVDLMRTKKRAVCLWVSFVCCFFCLHFSNRGL